MLPYPAVLGERITQIDRSHRATQGYLKTSMTPQVKAMVIRHFGSLQAYLDWELPLWPSLRIMGQALWGFRPSPLVLPGLMTLAWPWLTFAALMMFQISMRRAKVRPVHVLRCVIYSADGAIIIALLAAIVGAYPLWRGLMSLQGSPFIDQRSSAMALCVALLVLLGYRLWIAYRKYLRFDHALATVVVSQVMVGLLVFKFALDWQFLG